VLDRPAANDPTSRVAEPAEVPLAGGLGSGGLVVRVGDTVLRPVRDHTATVERFLRHLRAEGFAGAPLPLGQDEHGRQILEFLPGDVAIPPFPDWVADEEVLAGVAALQARMHAAARTFERQPDDVWDAANLPATPVEAIVCHNDLCVENVVVRDGRVAAFIDFDFAAPADPLLDIAIALRHWLPAKDPLDVDDARSDSDPTRRWRIYCAVHALDRGAQHRVVDHLLGFLDRALVTMRSRAEAGAPMYQAVWDAGYPDHNRRSHAWTQGMRDRLIGSLHH
jgi:Phosphotransferase enzyme family